MSDFLATDNGMYVPATIQTQVNMVAFLIPGEPVSKERPRFTKTGHAYTPKKTVDAEKAIRRIYEDEFGDTKLSGFLRFSVTLFLGNKRQRDVDNMAKLIQDALNGVAFDDDSQIHELFVKKHYTIGERARSEVTIRELEDWEVQESYENWQEVEEAG